MKKLLVFFIVLVVFCTMFISVYAVGLNIVRQPSDLVVDLSDVGYIVDLSFLVDGATSYQWYYSTNGEDFYPNEWASASTSNLHITISSSIDVDSVIYYKCIASDGTNSVTSRIATVEFVRSRFQYYSTSALRYVTSWVGNVVNSLTNGSLSGLLPVLAIGISIAALLLVVKIIKFFSWGA